MAGKKRMRTSGTGSTTGGSALMGRFGRAGRQKLTIMLIPHSEKRVFNFQISILALSFISILLISLVVTFVWLTADFSGTNDLLASRSKDLEHSEASLEVLRNEVNQLISSTETFQKTLSGTLDTLGVESAKRDTVSNRSGDLTTFFNVESSDDGSLSETVEIQKLKTALDQSVSSLDEIGQILSSQKSLLSDIPTMWPLKGVQGYVTAVFGPSIHPFSGQWYLHKGVDIAYGYGVPIIATANGKVLEQDYDEGYGNFVVVRHKYGFYTKYGHMQRTYVRPGQEISQGDVIGTMGNTGLSTGPHLHYEVRIGSQVVDPVKYINMTDNHDIFTRVTRNLQKYK
ncbi:MULTISPECIES: M23 family metallopeptidase [unclassified Oceanispirochaeta]|uniref:M23 family metallopeptidase n=1 Tax=unclassified Oceanispirochaeta TaxID=2635722 RepID=UPI000E094317|nr:M23 family metallopeptidase [Oceanispirochaeta sp. M1]MBF9015777.1 M23 family metallopeptidase [Oceanispirochaeta sp. M2]NPD72240.1 M23 family metallopeptidase [Oceanispirochaeta sp. M1]RDG32337.1 M23 family peptidase [Oceanispirochaeta sp. M1]